MTNKTWTNELNTNNLKASIKVLWNKKTDCYTAILTSTRLDAPKFISLKEADYPEMFNTAKIAARKIFSEAVA